MALEQVGGVTSVSSADAIQSIATASRTLGSGNNRLLVACISGYSGSEALVQSVNWDSDAGVGSDKAFTNLGTKVSAGYGLVTEIWYAIAPESGGTGHFDVVWAADFRPSVVITEWSGADQTIPMEGFASAGLTESATVTINITSEAGAIVIDCASVLLTDPGTAGANQTDLYSELIYAGAAVSIENGAATVTMSWAIGAAKRWITCGASINPAAAGLSLLLMDFLGGDCNRMGSMR